MVGGEFKMYPRHLKSTDIEQWLQIVTYRSWICYPKAAKFFQYLWDSGVDPTLQTKLELDSKRALDCRCTLLWIGLGWVSLDSAESVELTRWTSSLCCCYVTHWVNSGSNQIDSNWTGQVTQLTQIRVDRIQVGSGLVRTDLMRLIVDLNPFVNSSNLNW